MPPKPDERSMEVRHVSTRTPDCDHAFGPVVPGTFAAWVRRCRKCGAVMTVRAGSPVVGR